jgi:hypothetical protein
LDLDLDEMPSKQRGEQGAYPKRFRTDYWLKKKNSKKNVKLGSAS